MPSPEVMALAVPLFAAVAAGGLIFAVLYPLFFGERESDKRLASISEGRTQTAGVRNAVEQAATRRKQVADSLKELEARQRAKEKVSLRLRLLRAGLDMSTQTYWILSAAAGLLAMLAVLVSFERTLLVQITAVVTGFAGMFGVPRWIISRMTTRRQQKFLNELANSMDIVVRGMKSGLPLGECLQIIARESPEPVGSEFREVVEQQRVGVPLIDALERLAQRMPLPEVRFLTIVIAIQQQAGGNLSEALGNLSGVLRDRIRMKMKVKALSAEATTSAAVLASLPPGVMIMTYLASPDYIAPLFSTPMGNLFIVTGLIWMACGVFVMRKMINFKY